jgi:hypothetical protein
MSVNKSNMAAAGGALEGQRWMGSEGGRLRQHLFCKMGQSLA